jgi:hypothetical protein
MLLPDGTEAERIEDIDKYLKSANLTMASDYSEEYIKAVREKRDTTEKAEQWADFVREYKKRIWINE